MTKVNKQKIKKDVKLIRFFNSKSLIFFLLIGIFVFLLEDDKILNVSYPVLIGRYVAAVLLVFLVLILRARKYGQYYVQEIKRWRFSDGLIALGGLGLIVFILQALLAIPLNFTIKAYAYNNRVKYHEAVITNVITTGIDKVSFTFNDRSYTRHMNVAGFSREQLIDSFYLELGLRKSILESYYIESMELRARR